MDADCVWVVHPISGKTVQRGVPQEDPVFGGPDFLSSHAIEPNEGVNMYGINGAPSARALEKISSEYDVPPEVIATILQYENNPEAGLVGVMGRRGKIFINLFAQIIDPGHDDGLGYSQGIGNVKPATAQQVASYFKSEYPGSTVENYRSHVQLAVPRRATQFVAAYARMAIDQIYGPGYSGPMSLEGLSRVIVHHNTGRTQWVAYGNYEFSRSLLVDASEGDAVLIYFRAPN